MSDAAAPPRPGPKPLMALDEAAARLLGAVRPLAETEGDGAAETVSTFDALHRVLATDVASVVHVPPADNTSMDGYAVRCADVPDVGAELPVGLRIPAGTAPSPLPPGQAARVFTGAQIPPGADAVVMQEQCEALDGGRVRVNAVPTPGQWIRRQGEDVRAGAVVLCTGTVLGPQHLGLAASVGAATLRVVRRPRVALFSTGDELVMPGSLPPDRLPPGTIFNSNRFTLAALIRAAGAEVTDFGIVPDRLDATRATLREAAAGHDLILTSGGVSVGEEDHIRPAVQAEGRIELWQVAMKPGKPLAFGQVRRPGTPSEAEGAAGHAWFVGLPGNPVSSYVTFLLMVRSVLRRLTGAPTGLPTPIPMRADFDWPRPDRRREFLRVRRNAGGGLDLFPNQSSGVLTSAVWGDGLVDLPAGQPVARGESVAYRPFTDFLP
jgi:molybdopterin molybdotransferase